MAPTDSQRVHGRARTRSHLAAIARWLSRHRRDVIAALTVAFVSLVGAFVTLQMWHTSLALPQIYTGDGNFYNILSKTIEENGNYLYNDALGFPHGLAYVDYPLGGDNLSLLFMRVISWFTDGFAVTENLWVLITFPLVGLSGFAVMRRLGASEWAAATAGILYTFLPYHFRASGWLLLIGYYCLPFGILLAIRAIQGTALIARAPGTRGIRGWATPRTLATLATAVGIGSTGVYLAAFTIVLIGVAVLAQLANRRWWIAATGALTCVLIVGTVAVNTAPSLLQRVTDGPNQEVPIREPFEGDLYGLTLERMVIPPANHRFGPAARIGQRFASNTVLPLTGEGAAYIGIVGLIGMGVLIATLLIGVSGNLTRRRRHLYGPIGLCALAAFLFATVGGGNSLFSYAVSPALRGLGRISSVLGFCGLAAFALMMDGVATRLGRRSGRWRHVGIPAVLGLFALVGIYDQSANGFNRDYYAQVKAQWNRDHDFFTAIERRLGPDSAVYTLPEQQFPESQGPGSILDYDSGVGYLHTSTLRWSYGAVRGRDGKWLEVQSLRRIARKVPDLARCGFEAVVFDRGGVVNPDQIVALLDDVAGATGSASSDGRRVFYDLRPLAQRLPRQDAATTRRQCDQMFLPVYLQYGDGLSRPHPSGVYVTRWFGRHGGIVVNNRLGRPRTVEARLDFDNLQVPAASIAFEVDGTWQSFQLGPESTTVVFRTTLKPGRTRIAFRVTPQAPPGNPDQIVSLRQSVFVDEDQVDTY